VDTTLGVENTVELGLASKGVEDWEEEGVPVKDCWDVKAMRERNTRAL
jgi:hypothetical protein